MPTPLTRVTGVAVAAALTILLTACHGTDKPPAASKADDVASLVTSAPSAAATPAAQERPLIRPDANADDVQRLYDVYEKCVIDNGGKGKAELVKAGKPDAATMAKEIAAQKMCVNKEPEMYIERAKRTDPHYADKLHDFVTCVRSLGIDAWEKDGYLAFNSLPPDRLSAKVDKCEMTAFNVK
jgi:hypothetical protein